MNRPRVVIKGREMKVARRIFVLSAIILAVPQTAVSGEKSSTVVKEAGLRSDGELVQSKQEPPSTIKANTDGTNGGSAYKPRLKNVFITSYSTGGSAESTPEPSQKNKLNSKQPEK